MCEITPVSHIPSSRSITTRSHHHFVFGSLLVSVMACLFAALLALSSATPASSLPPRPETPTPEASTRSQAAGAHIQLRVTPTRPGLFTTIEWQDNEGGWLLVEGWQGDLDDPGLQSKTWWVAPAHGNRGPFRWVVYDGRGGRSLAASQSFTLPEGSATLIVEIALTQP